MNRRWLAGGIGAALLGAAVLRLGVGSPDSGRVALFPDDAGIVGEGSAIYTAQCAACHGANLEGQPDWRIAGPDGRLPAPPHDASGHTWHHDATTLFRITKYGVGALIGDPDHASDMPIYEGILTDDEIVAVLSYIKSTWPAEVRTRHDALKDPP